MKLRFIFFQTSDTFANVYATPAESLAQIELLKQENANLRALLSKQNISVAEISETTVQAYPEEKWWEKQSKAEKGFLDFNVYYDVEKYSVFTLNAGAVLPHDFSYFSLTNYSNSLNSDDPLRDHDAFYTEQNLRWHLPEGIPFELTTQWTMRSGVKNDSLRLGSRWIAHETPLFEKLLESFDAKYWLNFHLLQFDFQSGYQWQLEHVYRIDLFPEMLGKRAYVSGFADHNLGEATRSTWVTEHQLGLRLVDNLYAVTEYRYNGYRNKDRSTLGLGLEYIISI